MSIRFIADAKPFWLILSVLVLQQQLHAQFEQKNLIFLSTDAHLGNYLGGDISIHYLYNQKLSFRIGYNGQFRQSRSRPSDYNSGLASLFLFGLQSPFDQLESYYAATGKVYRLNKSGTIRANLQAGLAFSMLKEPGHWQPVATSPFGANYSWRYTTHQTISFFLNPRFEFPLARFYGLSASPVLLINRQRTFAALGVGHMIGLVRPRRQKPETP